MDDKLKQAQVEMASLAEKLINNALTESEGKSRYEGTALLVSQQDAFILGAQAIAYKCGLQPGLEELKNFWIMALKASQKKLGPTLSLMEYCKERKLI